MPRSPFTGVFALMSLSLVCLALMSLALLCFALLSFALVLLVLLCLKPVRLAMVSLALACLALVSLAGFGRQQGIPGARMALQGARNTLDDGTAAAMACVLVGIAL